MRLSRDTLPISSLIYPISSTRTFPFWARVTAFPISSMRLNGLRSSGSIYRSPTEVFIGVRRPEGIPSPFIYPWIKIVKNTAPSVLITLQQPWRQLFLCIWPDCCSRISRSALKRCNSAPKGPWLTWAIEPPKSMRSITLCRSIFSQAIQCRTNG